jgi:hypothetical protein
LCRGGLNYEQNSADRRKHRAGHRRSASHRQVFFFDSFLPGRDSGLLVPFVLCCGGDFATTSTARSKRFHASGCISSALDEAGFGMQPLSRVKPNAITNWGQHDTMARRPRLAVMIAHCIAQWSEVEIHLGALLAFILHANEKAAVAMYAGVENRAAQLRLIDAAAEASLRPRHYAAISALLTSIVRPAVKERDRLAHWTWGYSNELPDALVIANPQSTLSSLMEALRHQRGLSGADVPSNFDKIYVVRESDLIGILQRSWAAKDHVRLAMGTVWDLNPAPTRAALLGQLSNVPRIREALDRQQNRQSNPKAQPPSPPSGPSETA